MAERSLVDLVDDQHTESMINAWGDHKNVISVANDVFNDINQTLKSDNYKFNKDPNPIRTVMQYDDGYFFLPCFYALYRHMKIDYRDLIQHLRCSLNTLHDLLDRLEKINHKIISNISESFTVDTILYCAANMGMRETRMSEKLESIIRSMKGNLSIVTTSKQLSDQIRHIQQRHFPIIMAKLMYSCKKPQRLMWNFTEEHWQEVGSNVEVIQLVTSIRSTVVQYLKDNCPQVPKSIIKGINVNSIVASIIRESNVDPKNVEMDRHKWHIRTEHGILDLLTGHVGGTVPDFFMSEHKLHLTFPRTTLMRIRTEFKHLSDTYALLTSKPFFQKYLKSLFADLTDDLLDTLKEKVREAGLYDEGDALAESMYNFYVHFCKYMCFEYDRIMYLLDVTASLLIATNYARKIFIFKGRTRSGKSKFFQMLAQVLGGYSHTIRCVNLQHNKNTLSAQPELASTLFNRRLVMIEQMSGRLDEAMVKDITGNSATSFRNMYEQSTGGVPTAKLFASTNEDPMCTATEAFRDRVVAFPMEADFTEKAIGTKTSEQVTHDRYVLETDQSIIEDSWLGFFLMMYLHLGHAIDMDDGTLKYRAEPEARGEFKERILRQF